MHFEPFGADPPIHISDIISPCTKLGSARSGDLQVLDEETRDVLPSPIAHPSRLPQFSHIGINEWYTGLAFAP